MIIHEYIIKGTDGVAYTVIVFNATHALLSYETERGTNFLVAEELAKEENGAYSCKSSRNFGEDVLKALHFIEQSGPKYRDLQEVSA